ncbi:MAG: prepilin peptidase [bacterium]|nr:prepilin peptidase [bacterium]
MQDLQILFFIVGACLGSFGNVLIARLPNGESLCGRSHCPHCKKTIASYDLIPLVSYLVLRGRCRSCRKKISLQYPVVELLSGILALIALAHTHTFVTAVLLGTSLWLLLIITVIDVHTRGIHDALNVPFILCGIAFGSFTTGIDALAVTIGVGFFGVQWAVSKGQWVGSGDVLLMIGISTLLGYWEHVVLMIFIAYLSGALVASFLLMTKRKTRQDHLAFVPFLALGMLVTLLWGERILAIILL